ncbi:DNA-binding protein [Mesorhizobium sp. IMUNJ 23232]|uniref:DNA-binding protein n=1 Tax=Mesorhizobium sp. IMUNJ 23232 TaxID=3376064 RepID=UPI0037B53427
MTVDEALTHATLPVQTAGHVFFGLARNASYEAAKRGDFETIKIGGKIVVPVAPIAARLGLQMKIGTRAA